MQELRDQREQILRIATRNGAHDVRVFGSVVRGEAEASSDVDILVRLESGRSLIDLIAVKQDLEELLNRTVDVVTEASISPYIRDHVIQSAVPL